MVQSRGDMSSKSRVSTSKATETGRYATIGQATELFAVKCESRPKPSKAGQAEQSNGKDEL